MRPRFFYGWIIVAVAWLCYGFGMSPVYYSWGIFARSITEDLGIDRGDVGGVFGLFNVLYQCVGVLVGVVLGRVGIRPVMVVGFLTTALGMLYLSRAASVLDCYVGFSILGGLGIGFSTVIPTQTLGQNWFLARRALAIGIILTAGGIVGRLVAPADTWLLERHDWRTGWLLIASVSMALAVIAAIFVRDTPEQLGQERDGRRSGVDALTHEGLSPVLGRDQWTAAQAVRTPQFALMLLCGIAYSAPYNAIAAHLPLYLQDLGYSAAAAATFVGTMALISIGGRLAGGFGDRVAPQLVLAVALALEGLGTGALLLANRSVVAYLAVALVALGFGTAYVSIPVVFSHFFGRRAFSVTAGLRMTVTGVFSGLGPWLSGELFDATGTYTLPFLGLMIIGLLGAVSAAALRHPGGPAPPVTATAEF